MRCADWVSYQVTQAVKTPQIKVKARQENVSGVILPVFDFLVDEANDSFELTGLVCLYFDGGRDEAELRYRNARKSIKKQWNCWWD
jgi:hypothetical protein